MDPNPFNDLWAWYARWSSGDLPNYQSRRDYVRNLYRPLLEELVGAPPRNPAEPSREPTGWEKVDRMIDKIVNMLPQANHEEEYQAVGLLCRECLISLAQAVFDPTKHKPSDGVAPSETDSYRPFLVGAAGNDGLNELAFPARFAPLLAIGAINSKCELSAESNYGDQYNEGGTPDSRFVCPGGDGATHPPETVGSFGQNDSSYWHGTSFAVACASGLAANLLAQHVGKGDQYSAILDEIRKNADSKILVGYDQKKHGHGLMKF